MSSDAITDQFDDVDLPALEDDALVTGAAADSSEPDPRLKNLPRILRYAMLASSAADHIDQRLAAEIDQLCPDLALTPGWLASRDTEAGPARGSDLGVMLAAELDRRAVAGDRSELRSLADCVRLVSLPAPHAPRHFNDHLRVAKSLLLAFDGLARKSADEELCGTLEQFCSGWAALPCASHLLGRAHSAAFAAASIGARLAEHRVRAAQNAIWRQISERDAAELVKAAEAAESAMDAAQPEAASDAAIPDHHLEIARLSDAAMKNPKLKDIITPLKHVLNTALPLVLAPPLPQARNALMFEFPYANEVIDFVLADLVGRTTVHLRPLLLVGAPGGGKSRFARRLAEVLGLHVWRTDAARADGAAFAGTDKRWHSAEPCHPFLAVGQGRIANPLVLLDELEKAGTRSDYGRLWDCLLGFLEPETNACYPDPALQVPLDLSQVSYVATANSLDPLPAPIRDRFRIITFPKPAADDLAALLPAVIADVLHERGLDPRWAIPLRGDERSVIAAHWRGGSVRRLRRLVEAVLRERDLGAVRN